MAIKHESMQHSSVQVSSQRDFSRSSRDLLGYLRQLPSRLRLDSPILAVSAQTARAMVAAISKPPGLQWGSATTPAGVRKRLLTLPTEGRNEVGFPCVPRTTCYVRHVFPRGQVTGRWLG